MRYAEIKEFDINNGDGVRVSLWVTGCEFRCKNCHNEAIQDRWCGIPFTDETFEYLCKLSEKELSKNLSILGGEPLATYNREGVLEVCQKFKKRFPNKTIWLWTGYTMEYIQSKFPIILDYVDVVIDGLYVDELKDENLEWRGSSNQRIFRVTKK